MTTVTMTAANIAAFDVDAFDEMNRERFGGKLKLTKDSITIPESFSEADRRDAALLVESMLNGASMD